MVVPTVGRCYSLNGMYLGRSTAVPVAGRSASGGYSGGSATAGFLLSGSITIGDAPYPYLTEVPCNPELDASVDEFPPSNTFGTQSGIGMSIVNGVIHFNNIPIAPASHVFPRTDMASPILENTAVMLNVIGNAVRKVIAAVFAIQNANPAVDDAQLAAAAAARMEAENAIHSAETYPMVANAVNTLRAMLAAAVYIPPPAPPAPMPSIAAAPHMGDLPAVLLPRAPSGRGKNLLRIGEDEIDADNALEADRFVDGEEVVVLERATYGFKHVFKRGPLEEWFTGHPPPKAPTTNKMLTQDEIERYTIRIPAAGQRKQRKQRKTRKQRNTRKQRKTQNARKQRS